MKKSALCALALCLALLLSACADTAASPSPTPAAETGSGGEAIAETLAYAAEFDKNAVMTFEITADPDAWSAMLDNAEAEEYIPADVKINGILVENVGIRPKGNSTLSAIARDDTTDRYSFKIKFDEYVDGQTFLGLDKLVLNSNYSDASAMKEYLSYDIMSYIGVDAPLFAFADISLNGEAWGFYLAVEDLDGSYKERAKNDEGELYKPESDMGNMGQMGERPEGGAIPENAAPPEGFERPESGEFPENFERPEGGGMGGFMGAMGGTTDNGVALIYMDDAISSYAAIFDNAKTKTDDADHRRVISALKSLAEGDVAAAVDVSAQLRYLAAHTVVVSLDSYSGSLGHNYVLYENNGLLSMLPWDYNMAFGGFMSGDASSVVNFPIDTPVSGVAMADRPMISALLELPEYLEEYHGYLAEIIDGYFTDGKFAATVDALDALISPYIETDPSAFFTPDEYAAAVTELKKLGTLRAESVRGQLDGSIPATTEGQAAAPDALVDASEIDMSALGSSMGMGGERGDRENFPGDFTGEFPAGNRGEPPAAP